jgi:hypothetical protein
MTDLSPALRLARATLRPLLVGTIVLTATSCFAGDKQATRSCRDGSIPPNAKAGASGGSTKHAGASQPHRIKLSWKASVTATTAPKDPVVGYNIFRRESGADCQPAVNACEKINLALISGTSCTDYDVQAGHTYIYQAQAVSLLHVVSPFSKEAKATLP